FVVNHIASGLLSSRANFSSDLRLNYTTIFYQIHQLFFAPLPKNASIIYLTTNIKKSMFII
ncbi:MAG: hypothetical protein ABI315_09285, partial [Bacteroidia bacterium]